MVESLLIGSAKAAKLDEPCVQVTYLGGQTDKEIERRRIQVDTIAQKIENAEKQKEAGK